MSNTHKILLTLKHKLLHGSKNRLGSVDNSLHQIELKIKAFEIKESFAPPLHEGPHLLMLPSKQIHSFQTYTPQMEHEG